MYMRSLFFLVVLTVENVGAKVVVTFNPNWNKIFTGESLNMTCHVDSTVEEVTYQWFKDGYSIYSGKTFTISSAQAANSGSYQCQTAAGDSSDSTRLEVHNGYVILQVSPYVYEGDNLTLRCHHHPGYLAKQTIFYKNNAIIKHWGPEDELHIENVDMKSNAEYKCTKQVNHHLLYYQHTDETSVSVQELFSLPTIRLSPYSVTEGDHMALTCHTILSPLRQTTVLQFAFYRDGQKIQEFSSSNKYEIQFVKQHDAGDYNCEIKTSNYRIKKMSTMLTIAVSKNSQHELFNHSDTEVMSKPGGSHFITAVSVTSLVLVLVLVGTGLIFVYRTKHFLPVNQSPKGNQTQEAKKGISAAIHIQYRSFSTHLSLLPPSGSAKNINLRFIQPCMCIQCRERRNLLPNTSNSGLSPGSWELPIHNKLLAEPVVFNRFGQQTH